VDIELVEVEAVTGDILVLKAQGNRFARLDP